MFRNLLLALPFVTLPLAAEPSPWKMEFHPYSGLQLAYHNVPVIRKSTLAIVSPGWNPVLYHQPNIPQEVEALENGNGQRVRGENEIFAAAYHFEALDGNRFRIRFKGELRKDVPALIEYAAGYLNANLIAGAPFRGENTQGPASGRVPVFPTKKGQQANDLLPDFRWLEFDSRIGKLRIEVLAEGERVMFFDARNDPQPWARFAPVFWSGLGSPARPLRFGEPVQFEMLITIRPRPREKFNQAVRAQLPLRKVPAAYTPDRPVRIIPTPKDAQIGERAFPVSPMNRWTIRQPDADPRLHAELISLFERFGMTPPEIREETGDWVEIIAGSPLRDEIERQSSWFSNPEGYRLIAATDGIRLTASTAAGAFYGLQTLAQLWRPVGGNVLGYTARIEDWPTMKFRGAHWFPSASGVPFHEKLIDRIMARYKMNSAVIQCEAAIWETHPAIAGPNSIAKEDLRHLVNLARSNFLDPIPLINVPGHASWIFRNDQNLAFAEDRDARYAYCVNHPDSFAFIQDILNEAIEVFRPTWFHLGHDEVTLKGQFPHPDCPRCQGETVTDLVLGHMNRMKEWLEDRDIGMMVWGDMMLAREEIDDTAAFAPTVAIARERRARIPEGVAIADWHYYSGKTYPSLRYFHDESLPTIASTWYAANNIYHFSQAALEEGSRGLLQTTWAGFFPDETVLKDALPQFSAFILAAEYAWSGNPAPPAELPFEPGAEFLRSYHGTGDRERPGRTVDLSTITRTPREAWHGFGEDWNFEGLGAGVMRAGQVLFDVPEQFVVLGGWLTPDTAVQEATIEIGVRAEALALLNAAAFDAPHSAPPAAFTVTYTDGATVTETLLLGTNTHYWTTALPAVSAPVAWEKPSPIGTAIALRVTRWENPHPRKVIEKITFTRVAEEQAWILAGLTLLGE